MKKIFLFLFLLISQIFFGQKNTVSQENKIYDAIDTFIQKPNSSTLKKLETEEKIFAKTSKSKEDFLALVILNCNKAYYQNQFGEIQESIASYEKAWQLFQKKKLSNYDITEFCLKPLGNLYTIIGDLDNAENTIKHYFYIANIENNTEQKTASVLNLSNVYQSSGKNHEAISLLETTLKEEKLSEIQKGNLLNNLGTNYLLLNNLESAKTALESSIKFLEKHSNQEVALSNSYRNLASIYIEEKNFHLANSSFKQGKKLFLKTKNKEPRKVAKLYYEEALLNFKQEKVIEANNSIVKIFEILIPNYSNKTQILDKNSLYAETVLLDALDLKALLISNKNPKKALEYYELSFHIEELLQSLLVYENSKIISQIRNRNRTEKCIELCISIYNQENNFSFIESAFQYSEKNKATVLKQIISSQKIISAKEKKNSNDLQYLNTVILREQEKQESANILKINEAIKRQNEVMLSLKSLKTKSSFYEENLDLKMLFTKLEKDKATMLSYFLGSKKMYCFKIEDHKITLKISNLEKTKITDFLVYFRDSNSITNNISGYNSTANELYDYLGIPKKIINKNLIIIPDGILSFVPFEALITKKTTTSNFSKMNYLLNDFKISYENAASFYLDEMPLNYDDYKVLGVFPIFENTPLELSFSKKELDVIKNNFKGKYLEKNQATFDNFKKNISQFNVIHLSTHASSGDIYTPASIRFFDQEIFYSELYSLNINPNLVVLSACETGIGKLYEAEGSMSIARGFQAAGAKNILFSLWKVNDYTTSVFMEKFYKNIKNSASFSEANHQAKLDFLKDKKISNVKKSPYYWSSMVYYGNVEEKSNPNYFYYTGGFIGILALILIIIGFQKNKKQKNL